MILFLKYKNEEINKESKIVNQNEIKDESKKKLSGENIIHLKNNNKSIIESNNLNNDY